MTKENNKNKQLKNNLLKNAIEKLRKDAVATVRTSPKSNIQKP